MCMTRKADRHGRLGMKKGDSIILPIQSLNISKDVWGEDAEEFKYVFHKSYAAATSADCST